MQRGQEKEPSTMHFPWRQWGEGQGGSLHGCQDCLGRASYKDPRLTNHRIQIYGKCKKLHKFDKDNSIVESRAQEEVSHGDLPLWNRDHGYAGTGENERPTQEHVDHTSRDLHIWQERESNHRYSHGSNTGFVEHNHWPHHEGEQGR